MTLDEGTTPPPPGTIPDGCYWWPDPDGNLCLLPGCMARAQDPDADCTCDTLDSRLTAATEELHELREQQRHATRWAASILEALEAHPAGREIRADAQRRRTNA